MAVSFAGLYGQDFNSLATTGTSVRWTNDVTLPGWFLFRQPSTSPIAITTYAANNGIGATGTGADAGWIALALTNLSGAAITSLTLSFHGEQWRNGGNTSPQTMVMQ
jgi:hypothetical protein